MEFLFWHLSNQTAETQFIFNLFHLLLAGLTLSVLLYQLRAPQAAASRPPDRLLPLGFFLLGLHFALRTLSLGAAVFFRREMEWAGLDPLFHGLFVCGVLVVVTAYLQSRPQEQTPLARWTLGGCGLVAGLALIEILLPSQPWIGGDTPHSIPRLATDLIAVLAIGLGMRAVVQGERKAKRASLVALASLGVVFLLHSGPLFLPRPTGTLLWTAEQYLLSASLFAFAWVAGEHSRNLLARVFVRLNLTFMVLASLIMLITADMEKYQYLQLSKQRSLHLAEFLRDHTLNSQARGQSLEKTFQRPEVLRRLRAEFRTLPELREVNVYLEGQRASFRYTPDREIAKEIVPLTGPSASDTRAQQANSFQMIRLPLASGSLADNRIEFLGTMDYVNKHIGEYIILFYSLFTIMVGLATGIIGIIVTDADRRLRRQYAELQETHHQLAQAAKLASLGQLAGGMAHEINNPTTSILSLASHLAEEKSAGTVSPRQRKSLLLIAQQAERVSKIVANLLTFSRQSHLELSPVHVGQLLDTAVTLVHYRLRDHAIRLRRQIDTNLPLILGDAGRFTEVFVNLLNNAIDAMPTGGTLSIRAFSNPNASAGVRIEVADTGCGISPAQLPRIFDPFFTTKEPGRGTGLGLSISHGIVKDHGGRIWADSEPGVGTTLVMTLPKEGS